MINKVEALMGRLGSEQPACSPVALRTLASTAMPSGSPVEDEDAPDTLSLEEAVPGPLPSLEDMTAVVAYVETFLHVVCCLINMCIFCSLKKHTPNRRTKEVFAMWENLKSTAKTPTTLKEGATTQPLLAATVRDAAARHAATAKRQRCV